MNDEWQAANGKRQTANLGIFSVNTLICLQLLVVNYWLTLAPCSLTIYSYCIALLIIAHCPLPISHCSLPIAHCLIAAPAVCHFPISSYLRASFSIYDYLQVISWILIYIISSSFQLKGH
jgi:hypothetical protein